MRKSITRVFVYGAAAGAALIMLGTTGFGESGAATQGEQTKQSSAREIFSGASAAPAAQLWVKRYNGPGNSVDIAYSVAVSPDGKTAFVTGQTFGTGSSRDYTTIAYNTTTGARRWVKRYNGPGNSVDVAYSVAVSPDGKTVFVAGGSYGTSSADDYATIAYKAATGARKWVKRYNGPGNGDDYASSVAVSPDGRTVFVTGNSTGTASGRDYATIAYRAATGARQWVKRYNGPGNGDDYASSVAVGAHGRTVFVTGGSPGMASDVDYATIAYNAATGARRWVKRYNGPASSADVPHSMAVSPDGRTVFVTGRSVGVITSDYDYDFDYATIAYNAATGARRWVKRYSGPANYVDGASSVAVGPGGKTVFVTGGSFGKASAEDYATIAYNAATGARRWVKRYNGPGNNSDNASSVAVSPDGKTVFVTGGSLGIAASPYDYATIAYNAATGARRWLKRYNGPGNSEDFALSVAVSPIGGKVFVTGYSTGVSSDLDYATIAYDLTP